MNDAAMVMPVIQLHTGIWVANFSSPHSFEFVTGEVLPACSETRSRALETHCLESSRPNPGHPSLTDLELVWGLSPATFDELFRIQALFDSSKAPDICLVPLPAMEAMTAYSMWAGDGIRRSPFRCIRTVDRFKKTIHPDRFCVKTQ